jgi:hypothetical protein
VTCGRSVATPLRAITAVEAIARGRRGRPGFSTGGAAASNAAHEKNGSAGRVGAECSAQNER